MSHQSNHPKTTPVTDVAFKAKADQKNINRWINNPQAKINDMSLWAKVVAEKEADDRKVIEEAFGLIRKAGRAAGLAAIAGCVLINLAILNQVLTTPTQAETTGAIAVGVREVR